MSRQIKKLSYYLWKALIIYRDKRGGMMASSASFYFLITVVPTLLLFIRLIAVVVGDTGRVESDLISLGQNLFPDVAPEVLKLVHEVIKRPAMGVGSLTSINLIILLVTSLSFFNCIWNGIYYITGDKKFVGQQRHLKGLLVIALSIFLIMSLFVLPHAFTSLSFFIQNNSLSNLLIINFPELSGLWSFLTALQKGGLAFLRSSIFHGLIFIGYFTFLYRWFFSREISWKQSFVGAFTFVISLLVGKSLFAFYITSVKSSFEFNYGNYYTLVLSVIWIYILMSFFFYGACLCQAQRGIKGKA